MVLSSVCLTFFLHNMLLYMYIYIYIYIYIYNIYYIYLYTIRFDMHIGFASAQCGVTSTRGEQAGGVGGAAYGGWQRARDDHAV